MVIPNDVQVTVGVCYVLAAPFSYKIYILMYEFLCMKNAMPTLKSKFLLA